MLSKQKGGVAETASQDIDRLLADGASPDALHASYLQMWSNQDNLLQWYRSILVGLQAVLFTAGAVIVGKENKWMVAAPLVLAVMFLGLFVPVANARGRCVDYLQNALLCLENKKSELGPVFYFKEFQSSLPARGLARWSWICRGESPTRVLFGGVLSALFLFGWLILFVLTFWL